ncbi:MAG: sulfur carrier protein ThiS [Desulfovibrio sp.]|jgi:thiamine biosynthesis protein ThiS|nr:sulfur carrier protein ThiS [Desulfovibrio sp.]
MDPQVKDITLNGETRSSRAQSLSELLVELGVNETALVAELNGSIVPQTDFTSTGISAGDTIELVRFVGGG